MGDALADSAAVQGGAAGIIVDLFADGQLIPQLTQVCIRCKLARTNLFYSVCSGPVCWTMTCLSSTCVVAAAQCNKWQCSVHRLDPALTLCLLSLVSQ
mgnify:CR=1 FL=1